MFQVLPDGRVVNPNGALGKRLIRRHVTRVLTCTYCNVQHGNAHGPWRNAHA